MNKSNILEYIKCPCCEKENAIEWGKENKFRANKCVECGLIYVNPRPINDNKQNAIKYGMHKYDNDSLDVNTKFSPKRVSGLMQRLKDVYNENDLKISGNWLDVGAGNGEFIHALKNNYIKLGIIDGIEPNCNKIKDAQNNNINLFADISELSINYDYISLINVFSHFSDPNSELLKIKNILSKEGEILIVTGNAGDISFNDYPEKLSLPDHLIFTGENHIKTYLEKLSFSIISINKYLYDIPQNALISIGKHYVKKMIGKPTWKSLNTKYFGPFRSLWIRAKLDRN